MGAHGGQRKKLSGSRYIETMQSILTGCGAAAGATADRLQLFLLHGRAGQKCSPVGKIAACFSLRLD